MSSPSTSPVVTRHADVCSLLADPRYLVPPVAPGSEPGALGGLRANVSRFCNGADHARRRAIVEDELARIDPGQLRRTARELTLVELRRSAPGPLDLMARVAFRVPAAALASALGAEDDDLDEVVESVIVIAAAYRPQTSAELRLRADEHVDRLLQLMAPGAPEVVANRAGLLVQACDATAGLIGNALGIALQMPPSCVERWPIPALVAETLRHSSPVRSTRRLARVPGPEGVASDPGTTVLIDLAAANRDPTVFGEPHRFDPERPDLHHVDFGHGFRQCPGGDHAVALACGVLEAVLPVASLADPEIQYHPYPNLRIPVSLVVTIR